jgi:hypothetical protein
MTPFYLINAARNHLNRKLSLSRETMLREAGVPIDDRAALARWVRAADDANAIETGCVFHACTVRISNGVDADLPRTRCHGCRVTCVPLSAKIDRDRSDMRCRIVTWSITNGNVGPGYMLSASLDGPRTSSPAAIVAQHRAAMLRRNDCFATRAEAESAVTIMLAQRQR